MKVRSTTVWWLARGLLALHAIFAFVAWFTLPEQIPTHFGGRGGADAWDDRSVFSWFILLAVSLGLHAVTHFLLSPAAQYLWNIPEKERFLRLTPEQQRPVVELMRSLGGFATACVAMTMFALHVGVYLTARGHTRGLPWYINVVAFAPTVCLLIGLIPWSGAIERAILKAGDNP